MTAQDRWGHTYLYLDIKECESAINDKTSLLLKVHPSNYRVLGFTEEVSLQDLVILGQKRGIPVMNDLGSGCFVDLKKYGICGEPSVKDVLKSLNFDPPCGNLLSMLQ